MSNESPLTTGVGDIGVEGDEIRRGVISLPHRWCIDDACFDVHVAVRRAMTSASPRQRVSVELGAFEPLARSQAAERSLTLAAWIKAVVAAALGGLAPCEGRSASPQAASPTVKFTVRLAPSAAAEFVQRSRSSGLSYGDCMTQLLRGAPVFLDRQAAVDALHRSSDQLAALLADLRRQSRVATDAPVGATGAASTDALATAVHVHLQSTASLLADLRLVAGPPRRAARAPSPQAAGGRSGR